jgi:hypothetical protein
MAATTMHGDPVVLSDEQFSKLVELLTPGYELSKIFLAQHQAAQPEPPQPVDTADAPADPNIPVGEESHEETAGS